MKGKIALVLVGFVGGAAVGAVAMHVKMKLDSERPGPAPSVPGQTPSAGGAP